MVVVGSACVESRLFIVIEKKEGVFVLTICQMSPFVVMLWYSSSATVMKIVSIVLPDLNGVSWGGGGHSWSE